MHVIIELGGAEGAGMESHWVDFTIGGIKGEYSSEGIVGSVGLHYHF